MKVLELYLTIAAGLILVYLVVTNYQGTETLLGSISKLNYNSISALQGKSQGTFVQ